MYITVLDGFKGEIACTLRVRLTPECNSDCKHRSCHLPFGRSSRIAMCADEEQCCQRSSLMLNGLQIGKSIRGPDSDLIAGLAVCHLR